MAMAWIERQFDDLTKLAEVRFESLSEAENRMLRAAVAGTRAYCGPNEKDDDPENDASSSAEWPLERQIRADLIRWLCTDKIVEETISSRGITLHGARVSGQLDLSFANVSFFLGFSHCRFDENIELRWAKLAHLALHGSSVKSIDAQGITVSGDIYLCHGFKATGSLNLIGARIAGSLDCNGAQFKTVDAHRMTIEGGFLWRNIIKSGPVELDLNDASVGSLIDDALSWPAANNLSLDGFTYGRLSKQKDSATRLGWLNRQSSFSLQPYHQLAQVLREEGDDSGARHVLYEMEKRKRRANQGFWGALLWGWLFRWTIGYGVYPRRALWWLVLLVLVGWGVYRRAYFKGAIAPTNKETYTEFHSKRNPPENYPHFYALAYSTENCFPLVKLGQTEYWAPDPNQEGFTAQLRWFRWSQVLLGWTLATFFVAGITGIARKD
jgi:hypothetical protein